MRRIASELRADRLRREPVPEARRGARAGWPAATATSQPAEAADVIVALGGDGLMLRTLHRFMNSGKPIYGMHRGTVGFLMNEYAEERPARAARRRPRVTVIHPLLMRARDAAGRCTVHHAINEVSLFRQTYQAARLRISGRRQGAAARARRRRRAGGDARRLDRLQPLGPGPDHPDQRARCWRSRRSARSARGAGAARCCPIARASPSRCSSPSERPVAAVADHNEVRAVRAVEIAHGPRDLDADAVRSRPQPRRAHPARAVRLLIDTAPGGARRDTPGDTWLADHARRGRRCALRHSVISSSAAASTAPSRARQ